MPEATSSFTMHGARNAISGGFGHIVEQVKGIERAVVENPGLAFDLARTLVESVCRKILSERSIPFSEKDDLPRLFKITTRNLPLLPSDIGAEPQVQKSLAQTLSGLHTAVQGICELRNQCGFASHGSGEPRPSMEQVQAILAAQAADAIVGFIHRVHVQDSAPSQSRRTEYLDNESFNTFVDDAHGTVRIFDAEFRPSEILFELEPQTYRAYLTEFESEDESKETSVPSTSPTEVIR